MPFATTRFVSQEEIDAEVDRAVRKLGPEVIRVRHSTGEDTGGDPAIYFRIVLADSAVRREIIADSTGHITTVLMNELYPYSRWGLIPYFRFRSQSEQAQRSDPEWS